jgi:hypothetical protein
VTVTLIYGVCLRYTTLGVNTGMGRWVGERWSWEIGGKKIYAQVGDRFTSRRDTSHSIVKAVVENNRLVF